MTISYNNDVPAGPNNPSVDQPQMLLNTQAINSIIAVDHAGFNTASTDPSGYHEIIHQIEQGTWDAITRTGAPSATTGFNEVFALLDTPDSAGAVQDTQLFNVTSNGFISQLTGSLAGNDGYVWAGGLLFQWGFTTTVSTGSFASGVATGTVVFKNRVADAIPFPNNCYIVIPSVFYSGAQPNGAGSVNINDSTISNTSFQWRFNSNSGSYTGFYWIAIGQ